MRPYLLALLVVSIAFAGCLEESSTLESVPEGAEEPASTVVVQPEQGVFVAENRGILRGKIVNDAGFGLAGARVFIIHTERYLVTGREGTFQFDNVTVGKKVVRVEADGFRAYENETEVRAGNITHLDILMIPLHETGAGYQPHVHDFWGGQTEIDIMDASVDLRQSTKQVGGLGGTQVQQFLSGFTYSQTNSSQNMYRIRLPGDGNPPAMVYPGTKEVQVTISWNANQNTLYKVGISFRSPAAGSKETFLDRKVSGGTWKIGVTPDMWDTGHNRYSLWDFWVYTYQDPATDGTNYRPGVITGNFHIKIRVIKGEILPEPAHEDFWADGPQRILHEHSDTKGECNSAYRIWERDSWICKVSPKRIVPPGTAKLTVEMKWRYYQGDAEVPPSDLIVVYRDPTQNPWTTATSQYKPADCPRGTTPKVVSCQIEIKPGMTDAFYQKRTVWALTFAVRGRHAEQIDYEPRNLEFTMNIVAIKDPNYGGGGAA